VQAAAKRWCVPRLGSTAVVLAALALCGCARGEGDGGSSSLVRREHPGAVTVRITGGSAAQRSELRRILAGVGIHSSRARISTSAAMTGGSASELHASALQADDGLVLFVGGGLPRREKHQRATV
jgi:hypothetical protein